jgi:hypothetical protein
MARRGWVTRWGCGWGAWLLAGCLGRPSSATRAPDPPPAVAADAAPAGPPRSNYGLLPLAPSPALAPAAVERVRLEVRPAVPPPAAPPPELTPPPQPAGPPPAPPPEAPLAAALRCALAKDPRQALELLQRHDTPDRELLRALLRLAAGLAPGDLERLPPHEVAAALEQLHKLVLALQRRAPLALDKLCFCRTIHNFGQYEALPAGYEFQAGIDSRPGERVQVYAEVRNLSCAPRGPAFETVLSSELEIQERNLSRRGRRVVTMNLGTHTDRSQTPRQDFFLNCRFNVPEKLPPGLYTLQVTVKDVTPSADGRPVSARVARRSLDFKVVAPGSRRTPAQPGRAAAATHPPAPSTRP